MTLGHFSSLPQKYCNAKRKKNARKNVKTDVMRRFYVCAHADISPTRARERRHSRADVCTPLDNTESQRTKKMSASERANERTNKRRMYDPLRPLSIPSLAFYPARSSRGFALQFTMLRSALLFSLRYDSLLQASSGLRLLQYPLATRKAWIVCLDTAKKHHRSKLLILKY